MFHIDVTFLQLSIHSHVMPTHSPTNIFFPSAKSNVSLEVLFLLVLSHCPYGKVHVPNTELQSWYLYCRSELHKCFHLGDSLCPAAESFVLKKSA